MQEIDSRRLMANPPQRDKCANAMQQCACPGRFDPSPLQGEGSSKRNHLAAAPLEADSFLQSERNFLRSLPCSPLASASFEHSGEAALRGFSAFFSVAAGAAAGAVVVCALAELRSSRDAKAAAAAVRKTIVFMDAPQGIEKRGNVGLRG